MRSSVATAILILLVCFPLSASAKELTARVVDQNGQPLEAVSVITNVEGLGTKTDSSGWFKLEIPESVKRVTFSSVGFYPRQFKSEQLPAVIKLETKYYQWDKIVVTAERAKWDETPVAFDNITREEIERDYSVGEFPLLLNNTPNVHVYTDGGASLGYSYMRIRGFDLQRIATYINGVPLNDPEDHFTYFTDLPDFAANITDIQVLRGAGNSLYGDASFGGTINVATNTFGRERKTTLSTGYGIYTADGKQISDIYKQSIEYSTGLINGKWAFSGRFSKQRTGGYRHNSWYDGWAYYLSAARIDPRMTTELHVYGGPMRLHLTFWGVPKSLLETNRRYNPLTYDNETDNFNQPHYQIHNTYQLNDKSTLYNTLFYIRGKGYFEQFKDGRKFSDYNIPSSQIEIDGTTSLAYQRGDLVRQKWVEKNQVGWNSRIEINHDRGRHALGGSFYYFESDHWGQVVWSQHIAGSLNPRQRYYQYFGTKYVGSIFGSEFYRLSDRVSTRIKAQFRYERYDLEQVKMGAFLGHQFDLDWFFFAPQAGLNYSLTANTNAYINFAVASRLPNDENIYDADDPDKFPQLEVLNNSGDTLFEFGRPTINNERVFEISGGVRHRREKYQVGVDLYLSRFDNENVFEGGLDQLDREITINIDEAVMAGVEFSGSIKPNGEVLISANLSINHNRITNYDTTLFYVFDTVDASNNPVAISESVKVDFDGKKKPLFPNIMAGILFDYHKNNWRLTYRGKFVGRQYMELLNIEDLSIDPHYVSSISGELAFDNFLSMGRLVLQLRGDNLFDKKYEVGGYGGNFVYRLSGQPVTVDGWAEYYVAAEQSWFGQLKLTLF